MAAIIKQPTWVAYTPTITANTGTFTTVSAAGRYYKTGRVCHVQFVITITTNGTAASWINATLPFTAGATEQTLAGTESVAAGHAVQGRIAASASTVRLFKYDNTYPGASGASVVIAGTYETAS